MPDRVVPSRKTGPESLGQWVPLLIALGALGLYVVATRPTPPLEGWETDYAAAIDKARSSQKPLLIDFYMDNCASCVVMERTVLNQLPVEQALSDFVRVRVDVMRERHVANRYGVVGTPTYAVVDTDGTLVAKIEGVQPVDRFIKFLKRASASQTDRPVKGVVSPQDEL